VNAPGEPTGRYKLHWHVFLTHFPLALLGVALLFQVIHLYAYSECFELASTVTLALGVAALVPTSITGYVAWTRQYRRAPVPIFVRKLRIAIVLLAAGVPLSVWRILFVGASPRAVQPGIHWLYFFGIALMCVGAVLEGYYGGRLSHRPRIRFHGSADGKGS